MIEAHKSVGHGIPRPCRSTNEGMLCRTGACETCIRKGQRVGREKEPVKPRYYFEYGPSAAINRLKPSCFNSRGAYGGRHARQRKRRRLSVRETITLGHMSLPLEPSHRGPLIWPLSVPCHRTPFRASAYDPSLSATGNNMDEALTLQRGLGSPCELSGMFREALRPDRRGASPQRQQCFAMTPVD